MADSLTVTFHFYRSSEVLDILFDDNADQLARLKEYVNTIDQPEDVMVTLTSSASPEGQDRANMKLSCQRALNTQSYLCNVLPTFFNGQTHWRIDFLGEDWDGLVRELRDSDLPEKDEVIDIIETSPRTTSSLVAELKARLKALNKGLTWKNLDEQIFPRLRSSVVDIHVTLTRPGSDDDDAAPADEVVDFVETPCSPVDSVCPELVEAVVRALTEQGRIPLVDYGSGRRPRKGQYVVVKPRRPQWDLKPIFALKSNLLFDAATALNVEVEYPINNTYSVLVEHTFPWWLPTINGNYYALEFLRTGVEGRYWFGDRTEAPMLTGMFAGVYANASYFDLEWKNRGWQGETFTDFGATFGYSFELAPYWRLETSIGVGYFGANVTGYNHSKALQLLIFREENRVNWFGPTKLKCSISWLLPNENLRRKGGNR